MDTALSWERLMRSLKQRVDTMITRAVIDLVNDRLKTQRLQLELLEGETVDDVEHMQPYGLSFVPPDGAEALALAVGGMRQHTVAICAQHPDERPKNGKPRTGGLYSKGQWRLFIDVDGRLHLGAELGADYIALSKKVDAAIKAAIAGHTHICGSPGAVSDPGKLTTSVPSTAAQNVRAT